MSQHGPYAIIARNLKTSAFTDKSAETGRLYFYAVSATNPVGSSADSLECSLCAGVPTPWHSTDIGAPGIADISQFDGSRFVLEAAGAGIGGRADECYFAYVPMNGDGVLTARYVPQTPSQVAEMGLMMRETAAADAPCVALVITRHAEHAEARRWHLALQVRDKAGAGATIAASGENLGAPFVTWDRLMAPFWLRLERNGDIFTGSFSPDGQTWQRVGSATLALNKEIQAGLGGCSAIKVSTTIMFDNVAAPGWDVQRASPAAR
jgi:hypothetical protein